MGPEERRVFLRMESFLITLTSLYSHVDEQISIIIIHPVHIQGRVCLQRGWEDKGG